MRDTSLAEVGGAVFGHQAFIDACCEDIRRLGVPVTRETTDAFAAAVFKGYIETLAERSPSRAAAFRKTLEGWV